MRRSRLSSPITTPMSSPCCSPARSVASSSAWPRAMVIGVRSWCAASCRNCRWSVSRRALCSPISRTECSAASLRWLCHTVATKTAAMSGTSVSSSRGSLPRQTSSQMPKPVVIITAPRIHIVGRVGQERNPYSSVRLIQMKWKGIVSQLANQ